MKVSDFKYELPEELIAQHPYDKRDEARLMILDKKNQKTDDKVFKDIIEYLNPGDCLVINNTRVIPARLLGKKTDTEGKIELFLLKNLGDNCCGLSLRVTDFCLSVQGTKFPKTMVSG